MSKEPRPFITPEAQRMAAQRFGHRFKDPAVIESYRQDPRSPLLLEKLWDMYRNARVADEVNKNARFMEEMIQHYTPRSGILPRFTFRSSGDMLFVCVDPEPNDERNRSKDNGRKTVVTIRPSSMPEVREALGMKKRRRSPWG